MSKVDTHEMEILKIFEDGKPKSIATKAEFGRLKAATRATSIKDGRLNSRLSCLDLNAIRAKAPEADVPYQALMARVLHKYVTGRLSETETRTPFRSIGRARARR